MADFMNQIFSKPIKLANQVINLATEVKFFKEEFDQITNQTKELEAIFNLMLAQGTSVSYQRPLKRTVAETEQVLDGVIALLLKCSGDGIMKYFTNIPAAVFQNTFSQLESSVDDFTQILRLLEFLENHAYDHILDHPRYSLDVHRDYDRCSLDTHDYDFCDMTLPCYVELMSNMRQGIGSDSFNLHDDDDDEVVSSEFDLSDEHLDIRTDSIDLHHDDELVSNEFDSSDEHLDIRTDSFDLHHNDDELVSNDLDYNRTDSFDDDEYQELVASNEHLGVVYYSSFTGKYIPAAYQDPNFLALWRLIDAGDDHLHPDVIDGYLNEVTDSLKATSTDLLFHNIVWAVWPLIGNLYHTSQNRRWFGLKLLLLVSQLSDKHKKVIVEEGAISPLLKLMEEGGVEDQEMVVKVIGTLGYDSESVIRMIGAGVILKFAEVLKESPMKVQAEVAWAISEIAANCPESQDVFLQRNIVYLLIKHHLSFETVRLDQNAFVINKGTSVLSIVMARSRLDRRKVMDESDDNKNHKQLPNQQNPSLRSTSTKSRELEEPKTKHQMQVMTAKALCSLVKGNLSICRGVTESRALMWFVMLLDIGTEDLQYHSAMALMEITAVAEEDTELRRSTFKRSSPVFKAFIDRLMKIIENPKSNVLIPSIKAIGNLAKTFRMTEARVLSLLVQLLNATEPEEVRNEAINSLTKLACPENFLHVDYSKEIIRAGGVKLLVELVRREMQLSALLLLCYLALDVPEDNVLQEANVLAVLEWAAKQASMSRDRSLDALLKKAKNRLELLR